jgi:hypothetical protein
MRKFLKGRVEATRFRDESGAILVLALIFMVATALLVTGLTAWEGNDINNVGTLKSGRTALYAADGAIQAAIANTRYEYPSSASPSFCPNSSGQPMNGSNPFTIDNQAIVVWCVTSTDLTHCPISACTRMETLYAYACSSTTTCPADPTQEKPYVQSEVVFDDYTAENYNDCNPAGAETTCGSTMTVYNNIVSGSSP